MALGELVLNSDEIDPLLLMDDGGDPPYVAVARYRDDELGAVLWIDEAALPNLVLLHNSEIGWCEFDLDVEVYWRRDDGSWYLHAAGGTDARVFSVGLDRPAYLLGSALTGAARAGEAFAMVPGFRSADATSFRVANVDVVLPSISDGPLGLFIVRIDADLWRSYSVSK